MGAPALIGVVHLLPLPGGPRPSPGLDEVVRRAVADAIALRDGGAHALIVENFGDAPFDRGPVPPATIAAMTRAALALRAELPETFELGINVLRNDARAALGIAAATGARFVRINVHVGAMVTDQGHGFEPAAVDPARLGFAESVVGRLHAVGGRARVFSSPGSGTTVLLEVPKP